MLNNLGDVKNYLSATLAPYIRETGPALNHRPVITPLNHNVLLVSPHPDDECINGGLALRLQREAACTIYNFPFTFGSNIVRQAERKRELESATQRLGFKNIFDRTLTETMEELSPTIILCPHEKDGHATHIAAAKKTREALQAVKFDGLLVTCEFWQADETPNLLVEISEEDCATLMYALLSHAGEIQRNPYHLRLPFWMMENTRRGSELILGTTAASSSILLSTLYSIARIERGQQRSIEKKLFLPVDQNIGLLFQ